MTTWVTHHQFRIHNLFLVQLYKLTSSHTTALSAQPQWLGSTRWKTPLIKRKNSATNLYQDLRNVSRVGGIKSNWGNMTRLHLFALLGLAMADTDPRDFSRLCSSGDCPANWRRVAAGCILFALKGPPVPPCTTPPPLRNPPPTYSMPCGPPSYSLKKSPSSGWSRSKCYWGTPWCGTWPWCPYSCMSRLVGGYATFWIVLIWSLIYMLGCSLG